MSQNGVSGKPILAKADFQVSFDDGVGNLTYALHYKLTEPYQNGGDFDGELTGSTSQITTIEPTDNEIISMNKDICAAYIADRYNDPSFTAGDIRGGNSL